jgi:hypothetical protein
MLPVGGWPTHKSNGAGGPLIPDHHILGAPFIAPLIAMSGVCPRPRPPPLRMIPTWLHAVRIPTNPR